MSEKLPPAGWKRSSLIGLAEYHNGAAFNPKHWGEDGLPIIRIEQINDPKAPTDYYDGPLIPQNRIADGDLIFSWSATLKAVIWKHGEGALNQHLFKVVPRTGTDKEFLFHVLDYHMERIASGSHGSTMKHITRKELQRYKVDLPEDEKHQQRIAEILSTVDAAMEQTEALIAKQQQLNAGLMHDLFTRGVLLNGQLRPAYSAAPHLYKEEPRFGWIPIEWQPENFGDKIELVHGYQFRDFDFVEDGIPVVKIGQVTETGLDLSNCSFVSRDRFSSFQEIQIKSGDVLMALTGATLGKTCLVEATDTDLLQNYRVGRFEPRKPETVHKGFLHALLNFSKVRRQIFDKVNSGAQGNIGKTDFERVRICLPSYEEQMRIHAAFDSLHCEIKSEQLLFAKLRSQKQGLMQDLLTGRVPVKISTS